MLKKFLNNYFGFNKQQRSGLFVLLLISFFLLVVRFVYPAFIKPDAITLLNLPLIERKLDSNYTTGKNYAKNKFKNYDKSSSLFVFDPNTVNLEQLLQLGLKEKTAQIFLKFRKKGFVFREKNDLKKVYGISDKLYAQLEPYILIREADAGGRKQEAISRGREAGTKSQDTRDEGQEAGAKGQDTRDERQEARKDNQGAKNIPIKAELNSADSASLVALNGIGASYAKRILKYRTMLGGYVSIDQLKEVYGFSEELYQKVKADFYVEVKNIKKINLNKDDFKVINKHPYLTYEITKSIFDWRRKTTINPTNLKDILNNNSLYQKLLPYLTFD